MFGKLIERSSISLIPEISSPSTLEVQDSFQVVRLPCKKRPDLLTLWLWPFWLQNDKSIQSQYSQCLHQSWYIPNRSDIIIKFSHDFFFRLLNSEDPALKHANLQIYVDLALQIAQHLSL